MMLKWIAPFLISLTAGCASWTPEDHARFQAQMAATSDWSNQMFQTTMAGLNQTQVGQLNTYSYNPIQQSNGTWVRCIRLSDSVVTCKAY